MQHVVLYSGGPDSLITYHRVRTEIQKRGERVIPLYFDLGHHYAGNEIESIQRTVPATEMSDALAGLGLWEEEDAYIHHRNAFLVLAASKYIERGTAHEYSQGAIWLTVQKDEMHIPDRDNKFLSAAETLLFTLGQRVQIRTLWEEYDKVDMVRWYLSTGGEEDVLRSTWSCYKPVAKAIPCGECAACFRRAVAFRLNGIWEEHLVDPLHSETAEKYFQKAESGEYSEARAQRIFDAMKLFPPE